MTNTRELLKKLNLAGYPKNPDRTLGFILLHGWIIDPEQSINVGQLNSPKNQETYYNSETDTVETV